MNPTPLPLTTLRIQVFNDNAPVDATYEVDAEPGLGGFTAHLTDVLGHGQRRLLRQPALHGLPARRHRPTPNSAVVFDASNHPVIDPATTPAGARATRTGQIVIPNMGPDRYAATVTPPVPAAGQTYQWVQTTTLEGGHDHDIWAQEGETGYDTEQTKGRSSCRPSSSGSSRRRPSRCPAAARCRPVRSRASWSPGCPTSAARTARSSPRPASPVRSMRGPIKQPWVALSDLDNGDQQVYVGRGAVDGSFDIQHVPNGTYQLTVWDDDQDYILWSFNVEVSERRRHRRRQQDDRRLVHPRLRQGLRRQQRQRQARPRREGRAAVRRSRCASATTR